MRDCCPSGADIQRLNVAITAALHKVPKVNGLLHTQSQTRMISASLAMRIFNASGSFKVVVATMDSVVSLREMLGDTMVLP